MKRFVFLAAAAVLCLAACNKYDSEIADLQRQIDELVTANSRVNDNVASLGKIVEALQKAAQVTSFSQITEGGKVVGYTVTFKEEGKPEQTVTVYNSPANVSVGEEGGKYYWMVNGNWLTDDAGNKIEACTTGIVPEFRITAGIIEVSLDGGKTWKAVGEVGTPVVDNIIDSEEAVTIVMAGGARITIPKLRDLTLTLSATSLTMAAGGGRSVTYTITSGSENARILLYAKDGWSATATATSSSKGYIEINSPDAAGTSEVLVFLSDNGRAVVTSIAVESTK